MSEAVSASMTETIFRAIYYRLMNFGVCIICACFAWWGIRMWTAQAHRYENAGTATVISVKPGDPGELEDVVFDYVDRDGKEAEHTDSVSPDDFPSIKPGDRLRVSESWDGSVSPLDTNPNRTGIALTLIFGVGFIGAVVWTIRSFLSEYD